MKPYRYISYDTEKYNFRTLIQREVDSLPMEEWDESGHQLFKVGDDSKTKFHDTFYKKYHTGWPEMVELYRRFIMTKVAELSMTPFLFQKFPTFRVHLPDNVAVGAFHNDHEFGHPYGEINFILPLTDADDTASVWVESQPGKKDYEPIRLRMGQLVQFHGNQLSHGNEVNKTGRTRVSMDFRILPLIYYHGVDTTSSLTTKTKFLEGAYYDRFE